MAMKVKCIITTSREATGAYGIRTDCDENVYFPLSVADALELEEFEHVEAILVKNDRAEPPWKAIRARRLEGGDEGGLSG
jgi:hypothetical protein